MNTLLENTRLIKAGGTDDPGVKTVRLIDTDGRQHSEVTPCVECGAVCGGTPPATHPAEYDDGVRVAEGGEGQVGRVWWDTCTHLAEYDDGVEDPEGGEGQVGGGQQEPGGGPGQPHRLQQNPRRQRSQRQGDEAHPVAHHVRVVTERLTGRHRWPEATTGGQRRYRRSEEVQTDRGGTDGQRWYRRSEEVQTVRGGTGG